MPGFSKSSEIRSALAVWPQALISCWASDDREAAARRLLRVLTVGLLVVAFGWRAFGDAPPIERFFDDFFYYMTPVRNWIEHGEATYLAGEPTNGYHPLWFLWLSGLYRICGDANSVFFALVDTSICGLLIGFFFAFERFLVALVRDRTAAVLGAAMAAILLSEPATLGLELALVSCVIAVLLAHLVKKPLAHFNLPEAGLAGLLGAMAVLARLDAIVLAPLLFVATLGRWKLSNYLAAATGAAPLLAYFLFNLVTTGHLSTTAMAAKSLKAVSLPDLGSMLGSVTNFGYLLCSIAALAILIVARGAREDAWKIAVALTVAPLLQVFVQSAASGWSLFSWYFYLFQISTGLLGAVLFAEVRSLGVSARLQNAAALVLLSLSALAAFDRRPDYQRVQGEIAAMGEWVASFAKDHPGVYAMGDAAGVTGWLIDQPLVHLEGLMMSHAFHERIREARPLEETLRDFNVGYYVSNKSEGGAQGACLRFAEPSPGQAGRYSPVMRMKTCVRPVAELPVSDVRFHARIYRVDPSTGRVIDAGGASAGAN